MTKLEQITRNTQKAKEFFEDKVAFTVGPVELNKMIKEEADRIQVIDVRKAELYEKGHIPTAISIPGDRLESSLSKLSKDKINVVYCYTQQCHLAAKSAIILASNGYPVIELEGGFAEWKNQDFDVVSVG
ncbi:MAG: rhodanese [Candidatus Melainabacteria bacterium GWF2_37_15]|nr:MAG: rhodanese [Candidatus Melainabacteria bacterium GWF2_37_15]